MRGLFVYGTLHPDRAPCEVRAWTERFVSLGTGTVWGRLLDLGEYPGLVFHGALTGIPGEVFHIPEDAWTALDRYEGCDLERPERSLFLRRISTVRMDSGPIQEHWIYVFQGEAADEDDCPQGSS